MKKHISAIALAAMFVSSAFAQSSVGRSYIAIDLGTASYSNVTVAAGTYPNPGAISVAYGYKMTDALAIEAGGAVFGESTLEGSGAKGTIKAASLFAKAVGDLALSDRFSLLGNVGVGFNSQKLEVTGSSTATYSGNATGLIYGAGVKFKINDRFSIRALYQDYGSFGTFGATNKDMRATTFTVGGTIGF